MESDSASSRDGVEQRVQDLEQRVDELESIISRELGYHFGPTDREPQTVDCDCGTTFEVNVVNGAICPDCDTSAMKMGESA